LAAVIPISSVSPFAIVSSPIRVSRAERRGSRATGASQRSVSSAIEARIPTSVCAPSKNARSRSTAAIMLAIAL
jgi:hypothetical protein